MMSPTADFHLIYWPGIPGRGEHVRLALEEVGAKYTDTAQKTDGVQDVFSLISEEQLGDGQNPPLFAPPALKHGDVTINQTANILLYLGDVFGERLVPGTAGTDSKAAAMAARCRVNGLALTALDGLSDEVHDCHHPIATGLYYEDQMEEALRKSKDYVQQRLPKFLGYFQRVLSSPASGEGPWLYAGNLSYADLVLFQCLDGTRFQFPRAMAAAQALGKYGKVFKLYDAVKDRPNIKAYLASDRRQKYSNGIYRYYTELDVD